MKTAALLTLVLFSGSTLAETEWSDKDGTPIQETDSQKTVAGFGGLVIVTPDQDWEKKWKTPKVPPHFSRVSAVTRGEELFILTMFTNPKQDEHRVADVTVDIVVRRPDGSSSSRAEGAKCYKGKLLGPPEHVFLCAPVVSFVGEPSDPAGIWPVQITITDKIRKVSVPLATSLVLVDEKTTP
jgi:hypothetical protein